MTVNLKEPCPTCGLKPQPFMLAYVPGAERNARRHRERCAKASPEERAYYRRHGDWPHRGRIPRTLPRIALN